MLHYTCDLCQRPLDPKDDLRYVVKLEVYAAFDPLNLDDCDNDRDNLEELADALDGASEITENALRDDVYQQMRFDLCPECRKRFLKNPLGRKVTEQFDFSQN